MKKLLLLISVSFGYLAVAAQAPKTELLRPDKKKMLTDSTGYENIGDWGCGAAQKISG